MGVFDKIKNALFEVEYVEVEEQPKKEKKDKPKKIDEDVSSDKPIAKKIVLPGKKDEKIKKIQEEELVDQDFETRPKDENIKENDKSSFKFMDDADFRVEDEPVIVRNIEDVETLNETENVEQAPVDVNNVDISTSVSNAYRGVSPIQSEKASYMDSGYKVKERESRPYGVDPSYHVSIRNYGSYDGNEDRDGFKPSPIISPIYGILDKNYKKEDVVAKKEVRHTSTYTRRNMNLDDIRNKAYGSKTSDDKEIEAKIDEEATDENLLVDLSDEKEKPEVKEITVGDAMEYFQDLGLEYNVDYVDASNKSAPKKKAEEVLTEVEEKPEKAKKEKEAEIEPVKETKKEKEEAKIVEKTVEEEKEDVKEEEHNTDIPKITEATPVEVKNESDEEVLDDDNLFDLIDSMYKEDK